MRLEFHSAHKSANASGGADARGADAREDKVGGEPNEEGPFEEIVELSAPTGDSAESSGRLQATVGDRSYNLSALQDGSGQWILDVDGRRVRARVAQSADSMFIHLDGVGDFRIERGRRPSGRRGGAADGDSALSAGMTSQVVEVLVAIGDTVAVGDPLIVLEAMKMESRIAAPFAGVVRALHCAAGEVVDEGVPLIELDPADD